MAAPTAEKIAIARAEAPTPPLSRGPPRLARKSLTPSIFVRGRRFLGSTHEQRLSRPAARRDLALAAVSDPFEAIDRQRQTDASVLAADAQTRAADASERAAMASERAANWTR